MLDSELLQKLNREPPSGLQITCATQIVPSRDMLKDHSVFY